MKIFFTLVVPNHCIPSFESMQQQNPLMKKFTFLRISVVLISFLFYYANVTAAESAPPNESIETVACTGTVINTFPYEESFEGGLGDWTQSPVDGGDWTQRAGTTPSGQTGPIQASNGSQYFFTEASTGQNPGPNANAILVSPCLDLTGESEAWFSFDYHMFGASMGTLSVDVSSNSGVTWTNVYSRNGNAQSSEVRPWRKVRLNLAAYVGNTINVRINGQTGNGYRSDISIDNVVVTNEPQYCGSMAIYNDSTIRRVAFNTIDNNTPIESIGYSNFTNLETDVQRGDTHNLNVQINTNGNFFFRVRAYIDWNHDFDFTDPGETFDLGTQQNVTNGATSNSPLSITIPAGATLGKTRMRISSRFTDTPNPCDEDNNFFGEVEDYTLRVTSATPEPEMEIVGNGITIDDNDVTPSTADFSDFGSTTTGSTIGRNFTINNIGTVDLNLTGSAPYVSISGPDSALFSVNTAPTNSIAAGASSSFSITYTPVTGGTHNATLTIANNDSNENPYNFDIRAFAAGPQPEIALRGNGNIITDNSVTASTANGTDYGVLINNTTLARTFSIDNSGPEVLNLTDASPYVTITGSADFTLTSIPSNTIASGGGTTTFEITYSPTATGTDTATVSIANNDSDENPFNFVIEGQSSNSIEPEIRIDGLGNVIVNNDNTPTTVDNTDFDIEFLGSSEVHDFTITNIGTSDLTLTGTPLVQLIGGDAGEFSVSSFPTTTIAASGGTSQFEITYSPTVIGTHTTTVRILNDDTDEGTFEFTITGEAEVDINPTYTIYNENFNESDGGWTITNLGLGSVWAYGANALEAGTDGNYWYTNSYDNYTSGSDTYAVSPVMDFTGFENLRLQLDLRYDLDNDIEDGMNIEYSTNDGITWQLLGTALEAADSNWYEDNSIDALSTSGWTGLNDTTADGVGIKSQFNRSWIDLPTSLRNNSQARFRVRFADNGDATTDNGANFDNIFVFGNPIVPFATPTDGPGSKRENLKLWLRSSEGVAATSGSRSTLWEDAARDNDAKTDNTNAPFYYDTEAENINHNPVLEFSEADNTRLRGKGGFFSQDYWLVFRQEGIIDGAQDADFEAIVSGRAASRQFSEDATGFWTGNISQRFQGEDNMMSHMIGSTPTTVDASTRNSYGRAYASSSDSYTDEVIIVNVKRNSAGTLSEIYKNGIRIDNTDAYANNSGIVTDILPYDDFLNSEFVIGTSRAQLNRTDLITGFNGKLTEFISFSNPNSTLGRRKIQSYLAIKNGVTLHSDNSVTAIREGDTDYIDSAGSVIWSNSLNTSYTYDIAGIGLDTDANLNQKQSTSSNSGAIVTMGLSDVYNTNNENITSNPNAIADKNFLMWGNNNASFAASAPIMVDMSANIAGLTSEVDFIAIQRNWKVVETGSIGPIKISVPEVSLSATITPPGNFLMFISDTPSFSPSSEYRVMTASGPNLETTYDFVGTKYITFGYAPEYIYERSITFDSVRDYLDADDVADITGPFTVSAWVKRGNNSNDSEIISKRNTSPWTEGYSLRIDASGQPRMMWKDAGGTTHAFNSSLILPQGQWHHVAVIYNGTEATFFIDGIEDSNASVPPPAATSQHLLVGAADFENPTNFFGGTIDEVRIWNSALTVDQLRYIMNQEIEKFTDAMVTGKILPQSLSKNEMAAIPFASLQLYLPMNKYTFTNIKDESDNNHVAAIKNLETVDFQTAPLPYVSTTDGAWDDTATWENGSGFQTPGQFSLVNPAKKVNWNIVQTKHNVVNGNYTTVLALDIQSNEVAITNDRFLEISHYFKLDGRLDLVGESQLIQTENSDFAVTSTGRMERDQQGTSDTFSYNFYSSPVSLINPTSINQPYSIGSVMNDGSDVNNPLSLNFTGGRDGAPTSPITISSFWLYKFANTAGGNNAWQYAGSFGNIDVGLGFTMKGPGTGSITDDQNYTFIGKPNNSTDAIQIAHTIAAGNNTLVGNPFASALDADKFIGDNAHLSGTLYFWEHWGGGSHVLAEYEGGYAMYNLSGGMPAVSHPLVSGAGVGTKRPTENVPVGQGFFVTADADGDIVFDNSQRTFALESAGNSIFTTPEEQSIATIGRNGSDDVDPYTVRREDLRPKFRIGYDSPKMYHRQLLLTIDENATYGVDRGYDAIILDAPDEDMNWDVDGKKVGIQGVPDVTTQSEFNLRVKTVINGTIKIGIDQLENIDQADIVVYLKDNLQDETYNLYNGPKEVYLEAGDYKERFSIVFVPVEDDTADEDTEEEEEESEEETDEEEGDSEEAADEDESDETDNDNSEDEETDNEDTENDETDTTDENSQDDEEESADTQEEDDNTDSETDVTDEEAVIDMQVVELQNGFGDLMALTEMYTSYNDQSKTIVIKKNVANEFKTVRLFTMLGQVIKAWSPDVNATEVELPVYNISTGTYIIDIETTHGMFTKKLIIH